MAFDPSKFVIPAPKPLPVILLLDVSGSMAYNDNIGTLNTAVKTMIESFADQRKREVEIQVAVITFGLEVKLHLPYTSAAKVSWIPLSAEGLTPLAMALNMAKAMIEDKVVTPSRAYRPAVILVSDGAPYPSDQPWREALAAFAREGRSAKCERMALGIGSEADESVLQAFVSGMENAKVHHAEDAAGIADFFKFVTMSVSQRSNSINPNQPIVVEDTVSSEPIPKPAVETVSVFDSTETSPEEDPYW